MRKYPISSGGPRRGATIFARTTSYDAENLEFARDVLGNPSAHPPLTVEWAVAVARRLDPKSLQQELRPCEPA